MQYQSEATPEFIKKDEWPPQSPDCNPMDYNIWDSLKEKVYRVQDKLTKPESMNKIIISSKEISIEYAKAFLRERNSFV